MKKILLFAGLLTFQAVQMGCQNQDDPGQGGGDNAPKVHSKGSFKEGEKVVDRIPEEFYLNTAGCADYGSTRAKVNIDERLKDKVEIRESISGAYEGRQFEVILKQEATKELRYDSSDHITGEDLLVVTLVEQAKGSSRLQAGETFSRLYSRSGRSDRFHGTSVDDWLIDFSAELDLRHKNCEEVPGSVTNERTQSTGKYKLGSGAEIEARRVAQKISRSVKCGGTIETRLSESVALYSNSIISIENEICGGTPIFESYSETINNEQLILISRELTEGPLVTDGSDVPTSENVRPSYLRKKERDLTQRLGVNVELRIGGLPLADQDQMIHQFDALKAGEIPQCVKRVTVVDRPNEASTLLNGEIRIGFNWKSQDFLRHFNIECLHAKIEEKLGIVLYIADLEINEREMALAKWKDIPSNQIPSYFRRINLVRTPDHLGNGMSQEREIEIGFNVEGALFLAHINNEQLRRELKSKLQILVVLASDVALDQGQKALNVWRSGVEKVNLPSRVTKVVIVSTPDELPIEDSQDEILHFGYDHTSATINARLKRIKDGPPPPPEPPAPPAPPSGGGEPTDPPASLL